MTEPFLRWAGGKRWLARRIAPVIRERLAGIYREPFLGGGSMFFAVEPTHAALSDLNADLICAWRQVTANHKQLIEEIRALPANEENYYRVRAVTPDSPLKQAVRFIYLNRCCYGGLYRTNRKGDFNVPYGGGSRTPAPLWERSQISAASFALKNCELSLYSEDFATAIARAEAGDLCFLDPTYTPARRGPFDRYNAKLFTWDDQLRLQPAAQAASQRGAIVVMCNIDCVEIRALYAHQLVIPLGRGKAIGNAIKTSYSAQELLIVYDTPGSYEAWSNAATSRVRVGRSLTGEPAAETPLPRYRAPTALPAPVSPLSPLAENLL